MKDIDFLPSSYREHDARRKHQAWRVLVAGLFALGVGSAAVFQHQLNRDAEQELANWQGPFDAATAQNAKLGQLQIKLRAAQKQAELLNYLHHPWPRSQLLAAVAAPLPDSIVLNELRIENETPNNQMNQREPPRIGKSDGAEAPKLSPLEKDLQKLRDDNDKLRTVILLVGETSDTADLNIYLGKLAIGDLFAGAQIVSMESISGDTAGISRFTALLVVRPGFGQPGGPTPAPATLTAQR